MPWKESSVFEERLRFAVLASQGEQSMAALCRQFGISRQTGYVWRARYLAGGAAQMADRSRRPHTCPRQTAPDIEQAVVALRERYPDWGAEKLEHRLRREHPDWPRIAPRTVHRILLRQGLIPSPAVTRPARRRFEHECPNELWQMDFKGPQAGAGHARVGPLSILDDHSRYVLCLRQLGSTRMEGVRRCLREVFEQAGLPEALLVDHGTPWWNPASPWGVTELQVWIMQQGVRMKFSGIRHPQTQGKVERMHGALQSAVWRRRANQDEQAWLDAFRAEYNHVRPHQALGMATPASRWEPSPRRFQESPAEWDYEAPMEVVRLGEDGQLWWRGRRWEISCALRHQRVGLLGVGEQALVYFYRTPLRELDLRTGASRPLPSTLPRSLPG